MISVFQTYTVAGKSFDSVELHDFRIHIKLTQRVLTP